ncbi:PQQ-binding-like beta-propeller repeat protein [Streptomyces sp. NPDC013953]|uniref:outer membrane protein assembly factor BamB family protein n=1 Tax=Streptomyces sp. NPDC013953 TaxID=3364868 RepID=UPI0036FBB74D
MRALQVVRGAAVVGAGGLIGSAVMFIVGAVRMGKRGGDCTDGCLPGYDSVEGWATGLGIVGFLAALVALIVAAASSPPIRGRWLSALLVAGTLAALWPARAAQQSLEGPVYTVGWRADEDRPDTTEGLGNWHAGDTVVRARADGLSGFATRDGDERWTWTAPARHQVCAMSVRTVGGVGLVGIGRHDKPCAKVAAVRLDTGKEVWQQAIAADEYPFARTGRIALADTTAVVIEDTAVRGLAADGGKQRWKRKLAEDCEALAVDASAARALFVEECRPDILEDAATHRLIALDAATGKELWATKLPTETDADELSILSTEPAVIRLTESDVRGTKAVLAFDASGRAGAHIRLEGPDGKLPFADEPGSTAVRPARPLFTTPDTLVTALGVPGETGPQWVAAFRLADGRRLWMRRIPQPVDSVAERPDGRVAVLASVSYDDAKIWLLDPRTGAETGKPLPVTGRRIPVGADMELLPGRAGFVVANRESEYGKPPFFEIR